jgi:hypothetical protein
MYPDMPQAGTLAFNPTKAGAFAERRVLQVSRKYSLNDILLIIKNAH